MLVAARSLSLGSAVEELMVAVPHETEGQVKPELMQSVLEIATDVCRNVGEAPGQLEDLRRRVRETAEATGLAFPSPATHPLARWADQPILDRPRSRYIPHALSFAARRERTVGRHVRAG